MKKRPSKENGKGRGKGKGEGQAAYGKVSVSELAIPRRDHPTCHPRALAACRYMYTCAPDTPRPPTLRATGSGGAAAAVDPFMPGYIG